MPVSKRILTCERDSIMSHFVKANCDSMKVHPLDLGSRSIRPSCSEHRRLINFVKRTLNFEEKLTYTRHLKLDGSSKLLKFKKSFHYKQFHLKKLKIQNAVSRSQKIILLARDDSKVKISRSCMDDSCLELTPKTDCSRSKKMIVLARDESKVKMSRSNLDDSGLELTFDSYGDKDVRHSISNDDSEEGVLLSKKAVFNSNPFSSDFCRTVQLSCDIFGKYHV